MGFKAIIFDIDGVLADSEEINVKADIKVFSSHGIKITKEETRRYFGKTTEVTYEDLIQLHNVKKDANSLLKERVPILIELLKKELRWIKGAEEFFTYAEENFKVGVGSNNQKPIVMQTLKTLGIYDKLGAMVCHEDVKEGKPAPYVYLEAAKRLRVKPEECIVIEDSTTGIEAGITAGMTVIGIQTTPNQDQRKAAYSANNYKEVRKWIEQKNIG